MVQQARYRFSGKGWYYERYRHSLAAKGISTNISLTARKHFPIITPPDEKLDPLFYMKEREDIDETKLRDAEDLLKDLRNMKMVEGRRPSIVAAFISRKISGGDFGRAKLMESSRLYNIFPDSLRKYNIEFMKRSSEVDNNE
jgi:hypothetical protein